MLPLHHLSDLGGITSLALSKDNAYLVSGSQDKTINIYSMERRELLSRIELVHESSVTCIGVTSDNRFIISGSADNSIAFSDIEKRELIHRYENIHEGKSRRSEVPIMLMCRESISCEHIERFAEVHLWVK